MMKILPFSTTLLEGCRHESPVLTAINTELETGSQRELSGLLGLI